MFSPMDISCTSDLDQLIMMNFSTPEELNHLHSLPLLQTMESQVFNHQSPVVTGLDIEAERPLKHRSYMNTVMTQCPSLFGGYGVMGNLQPKQESTLFAQKKQSRDHIIAERRRREKLSQRFVALSTLVPDLKKTDKASVLGGTIKYLKQLQERVRFLEEQVSQKTIESVAFINKSKLSATETEYDSVALPEIEARSSGTNVLIRVHCGKIQRIVDNIVEEIEKLKLVVINNSVISFGSNSLHLTIICQMGAGFNMTTIDIAKSIKSSLANFMKDNLV